MILLKNIVFAVVETVSGSMDSFFVPDVLDADIWPQDDILDPWQMAGAPTSTQPTPDDAGVSTPLHPLEPRISKLAYRFTFPSGQLAMKKSKK